MAVATQASLFRGGSTGAEGRYISSARGLLPAACSNPGAAGTAWQQAAGEGGQGGEAHGGLSQVMTWADIL